MMLSVFVGLLVVSQVLSHGNHDHDHDHDHDHHHHTVDHLQKISGDCSKLAPLVKVDPAQLNGRSYIVHNDSYIEDKEAVCEMFLTRFDKEKGVLHTTENVQTASGKSWNIRVELKVDANREGYFVEHDGETAVVLAVDKNLDALCFAECGKLSGQDGFGAHVFCGTFNGQLTSEQIELINDALRRVRDEQGIDLPINQLKVSCDSD